MNQFRIATTLGRCRADPGVATWRGARRALRINPQSTPRTTQNCIMRVRSWNCTGPRVASKSVLDAPEGG
eukprot:5095643-Alexandrium_andersonii.AAC.1